MSLKKNVIANYAGSIVSILANLILVPIYLQFLSIEEYGLITFFGTLTSVFAVLEMGLGLTVNKEIATALAKGDNKKSIGNIIRTYGSVYWLIAMLIFLIVFFLSGFIANSWINSVEFTSDTLSMIVSLMGIALLFRWPLSFYNNAISGFQKMVKMNIIKIFIFTFQVLGVWILLSYYNIRITGFFYFMIGLYLLNIVLLVYAVWIGNKLNFFKGKFNRSILVNGRKYMIGIGLFSLIGTLYALLDKLVVSKFFLLSDLGYYSLISMITLSFLQLVYPISSALFPKFVEFYTKEEKEKSFLVFRKGYQLIVILVFGFASLLLLYKKNILFLWTQDMEITEQSLIYIEPLLLGTIFYTLHVLIVSIYTALGKTSILNKLYLFVVMVYISLLSVSVLKMSLVFVAYSWFFSNLLLLILSFGLGIKLLGKMKFKLFFSKDILYPSVLLLVIVISSKFVGYIDIDLMTFIFFAFITQILLLVIFSVKSFYFKEFIYKLKL